MAAKRSHLYCVACRGWGGVSGGDPRHSGTKIVSCPPEQLRRSMPIFGSRHLRRRVTFVFVTGLAVAASLVVMNVAPKSFHGAEQVAYLPLLLTAVVAGIQYRQHFGGLRWWWRTGTAMSAAGLLGGILALAVLMPWTSWPGLSVAARWIVVIVGAALLWGLVVVGLASLDRRRLTRIPMASRRYLSRPYRRRAASHR
jgi:hypothetical protein